MEKSRELLQTTVKLSRHYSEKEGQFYTLQIGTDPETNIVITDSDIEGLLRDLPRIFSTIINTQVLIEEPKRMEGTTI